jgi:hypothetical protein
MIDINDITKAIETKLNDGLTGYTIERNVRRNVDPNRAADNKGWLGVYRGSLKYEPLTIGARPWIANITASIETQYASFGGDNTNVEKQLGDNEAEILAVLEADRTIGGVVAMITGYNISYEVNDDSDEICYQATIIEVEAQVRA